MSQKATWAWRYSEAEIDRIGDLVRSDEAVTKIQEHAEVYHSSVIQRETPNARKSEQRMREAARSIRGLPALFGGLRDPDERMAGIVDRWSLDENVRSGELSAIQKQLGQLPLETLAVRLDHEALRLVDGGRSSRADRRWFVGRLAEVWESDYGERPTRRTGLDLETATRKDYGPFLDLARACIGPVCTEDLRGLDRVVRDVLSTANSST